METEETAIVNPAPEDPTAAPVEMRALTYSRVGKPSEVLKLEAVPKPESSALAKDEVLVRVKAAALNQLDVKMANGLLDWADKKPFPRILGHDFAGIVEAAGENAKLEAGTEVMGLAPHSHRGTFAEFVVVPASCLVPKPKGLNFNEAASLPLVGVTVVQAFQRADSLLPGGLHGKTILVPGALGGVGSIAVQVAKHVYSCHVITSVATSDVVKVPDVVGKGVVDRVVDYQKDTLGIKLGIRKIDFLFDTVGMTWTHLSLVSKQGVIVCISTSPNSPPAKEMRKMGLSVGWYVYMAVDMLDFWNRFKAWMNGVKYSYLCSTPEQKDLKTLVKWVEEGKVRPVVGSTAALMEEKAVVEGCQKLFDGHGSVGKFVVTV